MARVAGVSKARAGVVLRGFYRIVERMLGKVPEPLTIQALDRSTLLAVSAFEALFGRSRRVPPRVKILAELEAARQTGCPF